LKISGNQFKNVNLFFTGSTTICSATDANAQHDRGMEELLSTSFGTYKRIASTTPTRTNFDDISMRIDHGHCGSEGEDNRFNCSHCKRFLAMRSSSGVYQFFWFCLSVGFVYDPK
jgi:hypothetical protein